MNASPDVAGLLAELCAYDDHIPTGSRLSMPLSFWVNHMMYSRIHSLCLHKDIKMTVFVDDFTFSGKNVNDLFKSTVTNIIKDAGFTVHPKKTILYRREKPKLITGVIVSKDGMNVRNKHHKAIYTQFLEMNEFSNDEQLEIAQKQLIGRLHAAGQIDTKFKQRASQLIHDLKIKN